MMSSVALLQGNGRCVLRVQCGVWWERDGVRGRVDEGRETGLSPTGNWTSEVFLRFRTRCPLRQTFLLEKREITRIINGTLSTF